MISSSILRNFLSNQKQIKFGKLVNFTNFSVKSNANNVEIFNFTNYSVKLNVNDVVFNFTKYFVTLWLKYSKTWKYIRAV